MVTSSPKNWTNWPEQTPVNHQQQVADGKEQLAQHRQPGQQPDHPGDHPDHGEGRQVVGQVLQRPQKACQRQRKQKQPAGRERDRAQGKRVVVAKALDRKEEGKRGDQDAMTVVVIGHPLTPQPTPDRPGQQ
jgi:hypothetical protein